MRVLHAILFCFACVALANWAMASSEYIVKHGDTLWGIARRFIWLVCNPHNDVYNLVCRFDIGANTLCVLTDGDSADEEEDGMVWVLNKKIYLVVKNGEPDGAGWIEEWITPDGEVVRKGAPKRADDVIGYDGAVRRWKNRWRSR